MNKKLEARLVKDFPKLYAGTLLSPRENLMCFGFEVGDGWFQLIYDLSKRIVNLCPDSLAMQVKEKYGQLRFYVNLDGGKDEDSNKAFDLIDAAENKSLEVCEECGNPGSERTRGSWVYTRCEPCYYREEVCREAYHEQ